MSSSHGRSSAPGATTSERSRSWREHGGDLLGALAPYAQWTSSATHAVLPLLASDAGVRAQVHAGVRSHRRRFGEDWRGGFWLPECAYSPWLLPSLREAGVASVCVELTNALGLGAPGQLRPQLTDEGVIVVPIDRATISLVWSEEGYPAAGAYRDYHHHTIHHHNPWNNAGEPYDREAALALAREQAADFVARARARLQTGAELEEAFWCVLWTPSCWGTGGMRGWRGSPPSWTSARDRSWRWCGWTMVWRRSIRSRPARRWRAGLPRSWGKDGDLSTWSGPAAEDMAFALRAAELKVLEAGGRGWSSGGTRASGAAVERLGLHGLA